MFISSRNKFIVPSKRNIFTLRASADTHRMREDDKTDDRKRYENKRERIYSFI